MADADIDPFGKHESRPEEATDEHIALDLVTPGRTRPGRARNFIRRRISKN